MSRNIKSDAVRVPNRWDSRQRWSRIASTSAAWLTVVVVAAGVAAVTVGNHKVGLALAALVLVVGVFIADPLLLVVLALPGALLIQRVGGSATNLSAADLLVFVAAIVALFHVHWKDAPYLRQFLRGIVWFQAVLLLVLVAHPFRANILEWLHRWSYLAGSVLVGWVIATHGRTRQAFRLFLAGSSVLAVIAMEHAVTGHFKPAQWGVYQKNAIGAVLLIAILIAQINPPWAGLGRTEVRVNKWICLGGLLASQSRQSAILLILAVVFSYVLNPELRGRSKLLLLGAIPLVVVLYYSFSINARNNPKFNSVSIRVDQISAAIHAWHLSPILGQGMRFYNLPQFIAVTAPPNVFVDNLASTGVVGSLAFVFMIFVTMRAMVRLPYVVGTLGLVILATHYIDGLFDIFWIGASSIAPFIIAGISLGMADLGRNGQGHSGAGGDVASGLAPPDLVARGRATSAPPATRAVRWSDRVSSAGLTRLVSRITPAR
jgi:hypothetical protein